MTQTWNFCFNTARFILQRFSASWEKKSKTRFGFPRQYSTRSGIEVVTHLSVAYFLHYIAKTLRCRHEFVDDTFLADFTSLKISALTTYLIWFRIYKLKQYLKSYCISIFFWDFNYLSNLNSWYCYEIRPSTWNFIEIELVIHYIVSFVAQFISQQRSLA